MNKSKLIGQIAADTGMTRAAIKAVLNSFIDNTTEALQEGDTVVFQGFGTFLPWEQTERPARNPQRAGDDQAAYLRQVPRRLRPDKGTEQIILHIPVVTAFRD